MSIALPIALLSAFLFAAGSAFQHRETQRASAESKTDLLSSLLRRREWLLGAGLCAIAFAVHVVALRLGPITLVQPVIVTGIVFTVVLRAAIDHHRPAAADLAWAGLAWGGLALFVATLRQSAPQPPDLRLALLTTSVAIVVAAILAITSRTTSRRPRRGALLAAAAGTLFGLVAGLVKLSASQLDRGWATVVMSWPAWVLIPVGLCAVGLNQLAYRATRLSVTSPVLNIVQLVVAMAFGFIVFAERLLDSPANVVAQIVGVLAMSIALVRLAARAPDK